MELAFVADEELLSAIASDLYQSPEDFLIGIEDKLESGELTIEEAELLLSDFSS